MALRGLVNGTSVRLPAQDKKHARTHHQRAGKVGVAVRVGADKLQERGKGLLRFGQAHAALARDNVRVLGLAIVPAGCKDEG